MESYLRMNILTTFRDLVCSAGNMRFLSMLHQEPFEESGNTKNLERFLTDCFMRLM